MPSMSSLKVRAFTKAFFDKDVVLNAMDKATRKRLSYAANYVKKVAKNSIKTKRMTKADMTPKERQAFAVEVAIAKREGKPRPKAWIHWDAVSEPGSPPFSKTGLLRDHIYAGFDVASNDAIVGPALLNKKHTMAQKILEFGGTTTRGQKPRKRTVRIAARPYMRPALVASAPKFPEFFANSLSNV